MLAVNRTRFVLIRGDITEQTTEVIVNAANSGLSGGGGVDGAIHRAAGPAILAECKEIVERDGRCPAGQAVITSGGRLKAKWIVHAVGPVWSGGQRNEEEKLRGAYLNSLALAAVKNARSIAFPAISTGAYRYPLQPAARTALQSCAEFSRLNPQFDEIVFVLFSERDLEVYKQELDCIRQEQG